MFGSTILDVAIGLVFLFLAVSLAASAITEAISSAMKLRQTTLRTGIGALLNDPGFSGVALSLYNHALVNPLASGTAKALADLKHSPAYIPSRNFALALIHVLDEPPGEGPQAGTAPRPAAETPTKSLAQIVADVQDPQLRQVMTTILNAVGDDRAAFVAAVGAWFDDGMDRVSGWYKQYTQAISAAVALVVCVVLNADALRIGANLWHTPALTAELQLKDPGQVAAAIQALDRAGLLGWAPSNFADPRTDVGGFLLMVLGWLIVAGASVFGAPFWFDTLQRFVQLAGTGPAASAGRVLPPS